MIHLTLRIVIDPKKRDEAVTILHLMANRSRVYAGCISCRAYTDVRKDQILMFEAVWENEVGMNRYLRSGEFRNVLLAVEMGVQKPQIRFATVLDVSGMDTIEKAWYDGE